eukprot:15584974-Heterocapsa_arctica.AAC.1
MEGEAGAGTERSKAQAEITKGRRKSTSRAVLRNAAVPGIGGEPAMRNGTGTISTRQSGIMGAGPGAMAAR